MICDNKCRRITTKDDRNRQIITAVKPAVLIPLSHHTVCIVILC